MSFNKSKVYQGEGGYLELVEDVLREGVDIPDRTGVGCRAIFDAKVVFNTDVQFPFSTVRPMPLRMAFEEFWMFMRGETQTKVLEEKGINFWKGNTSREFLDRRGLTQLPEGCMGKAYGFQWRNFGGDLQVFSDDSIAGVHGVDQLKGVYEELSNNKYSRRMHTTFWNPEQTPDMALTPCWHSHQWVVLPNQDGVEELHLKVLSRSLDAVFGFYFGVQQYALYQQAMAKLLGVRVGKLSCDLSHVHIYENQIEYAEELITRKLGLGGVVDIKKELKCLDDLVTLTWEDIEVEGLIVNKTPFKAVRPPMAV